MSQVCLHLFFFKINFFTNESIYQCLESQNRLIKFTWIDPYYHVLIHAIMFWPYYFVRRMASMKECGKNTTLNYTSPIMKIIKQFNVPLPIVPMTPIIRNQEFDQATMSYIGYHWDKDQRCLYFKAKSSRTRVYDFEDLANQVLVDEDDAFVDEDMVEAEDAAAANNQGWEEWVPNH